MQNTLTAPVLKPFYPNIVDSCGDFIFMAQFDSNPDTNIYDLCCRFIDGSEALTMEQKQTLANHFKLKL